MAEPFTGEIRIWACNFAPRNWTMCDGQTIPISQNSALFSLLGTIYGGDGRNDFAVPNLKDRIPLHQGTGPGLTNRRIGAVGGTNDQSLATSQIPSHSHTMYGEDEDGTTSSPTNVFLAELLRSLPTNFRKFYGVSTSSEDRTMSSNAIAATGGGQTHNNEMPTLTIRYCIALTGIYPSRG